MNNWERHVVAQLRDHGLTVLANGWPDFLVVNPAWGEAFGVEWKEPGDRVRPDQAKMHDALEKNLGVVTLVTGSIEDVVRFRAAVPSEHLERLAGVERRRLLKQIHQLEDRLEMLRERLRRESGMLA